MQPQSPDSDTRILIIRMNHSNAGFFAYLTFVLNQILYCEEHGLLPVVYFGPWSVDGPNAYHDADRGDNMWDYYFEPVAGYTHSDIQSLMADPNHPVTEKNLIYLEDNVMSYLHGGNPDSIYNFPYGYYTDLEENPDQWYARQRQKAQRVIRKYIRVKKELLTEVDAFIEQNFTGHQVLGVHIRGTDKERQSKRIEKIIPPEKYFPYIDEFIGQFPDSKIFLATDQTQYVGQMEEKYPGRVLTQSTILSDSNVNSFQKADGNNYQKGKEVLFDCLLLSRCHQIVKCASAVGEYAFYFNAELEGPDLNEVYSRQTPYQKVTKLLLIEPFTFFGDFIRIAKDPAKGSAALLNHALGGYPLLRRLLDRLEATQFSGSSFWQPLFFIKKYIALIRNKDELPFQQTIQIVAHGRKRVGAGYYSFRKARGKKYLEIRTDGDPSATFFTQILCVLEQLRFAEVHQLIPVVNLDQVYNYYHDKDHGTNVWENYFGPVKGMTPAELDNTDSKTITFIRPEEQRVFYPEEANLDLQDQNQRAYQRSVGARLTARYIHPGPEVQRAVDDFYKRHMHGQTVLGVHISGVDNYVRFEGKRVPFGKVIPLDEYAPYIEAFLTQNPGGKLFVSTDKDALRTAVVEKYGDRIIQVNLEKTSLRRSGRGYQHGFEALVGALLLSKCDFLIRGWSNTAEVATYFNPSMPVIDLFYPQNIDDIGCFFQVQGTINHQPLKK